MLKWGFPGRGSNLKSRRLHIWWDYPPAFPYHSPCAEAPYHPGTKPSRGARSSARTKYKPPRLVTTPITTTFCSRDAFERISRAHRLLWTTAHIVSGAPRSALACASPQHPVTPQTQSSSLTVNHPRKPAASQSPRPTPATILSGPGGARGTTTDLGSALIHRAVRGPW